MYVCIYIYIYIYIYISILFLQQKLLQNNILQSISDNYRGKLVNKNYMKNHYYKSNKITQ